MRCALALALLGTAASAAEWAPRAIPPETPLPEAAPLWYRSYLQVPNRLVDPAGEKDLWRNSMVLAVADLPGPFEVFLNGQKIAASDGVPEGTEERLKVPKGIFEKGVFNALVFKLDGGSAKQGLRAAPVFLDYFNELIMSSPWEVSREQPSADELKARTAKPELATYTVKDFRLARRGLAPTGQAMPGRRVPPAEALELLETDDDLAVDALLSEPEIAQPTHVSFDGRGRMWVAQYRQYPYPAGVKMLSRDQYYRSKYDRVPPAPPNHDRGADIISVHEDADGDGVYESSKNVLEGLNMANSALRGWGGIWVMHTPYLLFYPDADGDDLPDGDPEVRLAGFGLEDTHSTANGLAWGPDGWLYGAHGSTTTSRVTRPGTDPPDAAGIYNEGPIVWRYHPRERRFEVFADGGGNTFGLSFDAEGRLFSGHNGGNTRGFHFIQGGLYLKQGKNPGKFGPPPNPFAFGELEMMRSSNPIPRFSHLTIAVDASAMPDRLQGKFLSIDPLHHRAIAAERTPAGSTFTTSDRGFPLRTEDRTFRPVYLTGAPCGGVVIADFREEYIAHGQNYQGQIDPDSGRIYRLRGEGAKLETDRNLEAKSSAELVALLDHDNLWHRQTAARLLGQRADAESVAPLKKLLGQGSTHPVLEALWALHQMGQFDSSTALRLLDHPAPMVRAWAIRLRGDRGQLARPVFDKILALAAKETDAEVRAQILSTARRLKSAQALPLAKAVAIRPEGNDDPFIPMMTWFVIEAHAIASRDEALALFADASEFWSAPLVREHIVPRLMRRYAAAGSPYELLTCAKLLELAPGEADRAALRAGFEQAFEGRTLPELPIELASKLGELSLSARIRSGDGEAVETGLRLLANAGAKLDERLAVARAFGSAHHERAAELLLQLAKDGTGPIELRRAALNALHSDTRPAVGAEIAKLYPKLPPGLKTAANDLLASRASWAVAMLQAHAAGKIAADEFDPVLLDRIALHTDERIGRLLEEHFPAAAAPPASASSEAILEVLRARPGDPYKGEPLYMQRCAACHKLFFRGIGIGPDLTSYQRDDLSTMLPSILDPSAEIREGYETAVVRAKDGRVISGFLKGESADSIVIMSGLDDTPVMITRASISSIETTGRSLMPDGLLNGLSDTQLRDLFAYLRISQPISK